MRPTSPSRSRRFTRPRSHGFNLIELVIAIVITGIAVGGVVYFLYPVRQSVDIAVRAELTDTADAALQRMGRDLRLALPNSVRVRIDSGITYLEFLPIKAAGRYRAAGGGGSGGTNCPNDETALGVPDNDQLSFDTAADTCFKTLGKVANIGTATASDFLVLNNFGSGFAGQNAYDGTAPANRAAIASVNTSETSRDRVAFASTTFRRNLHDSDGKRFYIVSSPVSYVCDPALKTIVRYSGYAINATQPITFGATVPAQVASRVSTCQFDYTQNIAPMVGLVTLRIKLSQPLSSGLAEEVALYHAVHVSNLP